ncbi:MAG TPA: hypothetical protein PK852_02520 [Mesotoga prima]|uniref:hypothetical protein n=1 Tax=Mesotoga prima TaxID=1184387 RepID=UPI002CE59C46|nr:hypothetical protein [Mesotoga prima]HPE52969.1 hypothetical protein [Mesotoga prima]
MMTALEALLKSMLQQGWFTASDGDVESPLGYFGWTWVVEDDLYEIREAFSDVIKAYGDPGHKLIGNWFAVLNSNGILSFWDKDNRHLAERNYSHYVTEYNEWLEKTEEEV